MPYARQARAALFVFASLVAPAGLAQAACYDDGGCSDKSLFDPKSLNDPVGGPNCEFLYEMRGEIFAEHHYCFKTAKALANWSNAGCVSSNTDTLGLNAFERKNVDMIFAAEKGKGCAQ